MNTPSLIVVGASGRIGREVARLGIAYGADVYGITRSGKPEIDEPWAHGVHWVARDFDAPGAFAGLPESGALVVAAPVQVPADAAERFHRVVILTSVRPLTETPSSVITASPGAIDATPLEDDEFELAEGTIRVETVGMALLRAAFDDDIPSHLDHEELATLGDAMMLQG